MGTTIPSIDELVESSSRYAQKALDFHNTHEFEFVPIFAITAIEHITKACLISIHPTLLLELKGKDNLKSLLYLNKVNSNMPETFRSVSLTDALERVKPIIGSKTDEKDLKNLVKLRDGSVHLAEIAKTETNLLVAFISQVNFSLDYLKIEKDGFWGVQSLVAERVVEDKLSNVAKEVSIKMEQGWVRFEKKNSSLPVEAVAELFKSFPKLRYGELAQSCPICQCLGVLTGDLEVIYDTDVTDGGEVERDGYPVLFANSFKCAVCELHLVSSNELDASGLGSTFNSSLTVSEIEKFFDE